MGKKTLLFAALVAAVTLGLSSGALGGLGGEDLPPLTVSPQSGQPGQSFTVSGSQCFHPDQGLEVRVNGFVGPEVDVTVNFPTPLTQTTNANQEGTWSVTFTVPVGTPPGTYSVTATCHNESETGSASGDVAAAQTPYPPGTAFTVTAAPSVPVPPTAAPAPAPAPPPAPPVAATPRTAG